MTDLHLNIKAIDSLMFRDGRPFNQNDAGASIANSVFPPYPPTIIGAIRAAMWARLGGKWPANGALGDGTNWQSDKTQLGPLRFTSPLLLKNNDPVFPVPMHIVWDQDKKISRLKPGPKVECDLGFKSLPIADVKGIKAIEDHWVTLSGMTEILSGSAPSREKFIKTSDLWAAETRVGIGINRESRTTTDGQLYMASHIRMADDVSLAISSSGWSGEYADFRATLRPLAGEHRMAHITSSQKYDLPKTQFNDGAEKYCLIALGPVVPNQNGDIEGLPDGLVCACLGKPISIGGWNSGANGSIPLRQCYPAGSVWFFEGEQSLEGLPLTGASIGLSNEWGFGHVMIGKW